MIKASDQIRKMTGNETNTANMMKFFCKNTVAQSERQKFWDFVNPDTLAERLQGKDYINCQTEIGKGEWFSIMLVPQHHDAHGNVEAALFLRWTIRKNWKNLWNRQSRQTLRKRISYGG